MDDSETIQGVYFKIEVSKIGTGFTEKFVRTKIFCEAREVDDHQVEVSYLGFGGKPSGIREILARDRFLKDFIFFSPTYEPKDDRKKRSLGRHILMADEHFRKREYFAAEYEYDNALRLDEKNVRASFGKGLSLMERGERDKAREIFTHLARLEALFLEENKHLFNEFGIRLRKLDLYDEAVRHYQKAISIGPDDDHLYFNLARAYFQKRDREQAKKWAQIALKTEPDFKEARDLLDQIEEAGPSFSQIPEED